MLTHGDRPRQLQWWQAGPMLYGDWGTSRLYVLGLALYYTQYAAFSYLVAMCVMLVAVGWAYEVICRQYPEGGGVYTAARQRSHLLGMIGALLLCADYVVTAAISAVEAVHYTGWLPHSLDWSAGYVAAALIGIVGVVNWYGPSKAGTVAAVIAVATIGVSLVIAAFAVPQMGAPRFDAVQASPLGAWTQFTKLILAISGVEAIANMTGIMVKPVESTARKSIYPVLFEIVILNLLLGLAFQALPKEEVFDKLRPASTAEVKEELEHRSSQLGWLGRLTGADPAQAAATTKGWVDERVERERHSDPGHAGERLPVVLDGDAGRLTEGDETHVVSREAKDTALKILARKYVGKSFAAVAAVVFALLLLSAVNTSVGSLVSIQYMMSADKELPAQLKRLNAWGMPLLPLVIGTIVPMVTVILVPKVEHLADLYAIGVVGAVTINLAACSTNMKLSLRVWERWPIFALSLVMAAIWFTIAWEKPFSLVFAGAIVGAGLLGRYTTQHARKIGKTMLEPVLEMVEKGAAAAHQIVAGDEPKKRLLVSTYGNMKLLKHAIEQANLQDAELMVLFVRYVAVVPMGDVAPDDWHEDAAATKMFEQVQAMAKEAGIKVHLVYVQSHDIAGTILDMAVTYGVTELFLGTTQRGSLWRTMKGDVIQQVAQYLPEPIKLIIHA